MHSVPARVDSAYWNGLVARSIAGPSCCAILLATSRLFTYSCHDPADSPVGLLQRRQSSHSECFQDLKGNPGTSEELSDLKQQLTIARVLQDRLQMFSSHARWTCCRATTGTFQILHEDLFLKRERNLSLTVAERLWQRRVWHSWASHRFLQLVQEYAASLGAPSRAWRPANTSPIMINDWALSALRSGLSTLARRRQQSFFLWREE